MVVLKSGSLFLNSAKLRVFPLLSQREKKLQCKINPLIFFLRFKRYSIFQFQIFHFFNDLKVIISALVKFPHQAPFRGPPPLWTRSHWTRSKNVQFLTCPNQFRLAHLAYYYSHGDVSIIYTNAYLGGTLFTDT